MMNIFLFFYYFFFYFFYYFFFYYLFYFFYFFFFAGCSGNSRSAPRVWLRVRTKRPGFRQGEGNANDVLPHFRTKAMKARN